MPKMGYSVDTEKITLVKNEEYIPSKYAHGTILIEKR